MFPSTRISTFSLSAVSGEGGGLEEAGDGLRGWEGVGVLGIGLRARGTD